MRVAQNSYDRITFSLPSSMNIALDNLKNDTKTSKSEIIKLAIAHYLSEQKKIKLKRAVEIMSHDYDKESELTSLTRLDHEDFL